MSRYCWTTLVLRIFVLAGLGGVVGCKQQLFIDPADYAKTVTANLPPYIESNPHAAIMPPVVDRLGGGLGPATVLDPSRPPRFMTLRECIAMALEQGNVGSTFVGGQFGNPSESLPQFNGGVNNTTDAIRAFALDPGYNAASIERALSRFDARWVTSMSWQKVDQPVAAQFLSFQQQRDAASFNTALIKPLPTGGFTQVSFGVDYSKFAANSTQAGFVNPNYTPRVQFSFEQPLLQLFGVEINQLVPLNAAPRGQFIQGAAATVGSQITQGGGEGILVTRIRSDQSRSQFENAVNFMLVNVEAAYWNLYAAYYNLYAREEGLRQSYEGYRFTSARVPNIDPPQQLDQARAQLELFRGQVYTARGQVLSAERALRRFIGMRSDDGTRIVPADEPNLAPFRPDFYEAAQDAMTYRPELMLARQEVKVQQLQLELAKNLRRPDLRSFAQYDVAGLGTRLDGSELIGTGGTTPGNAFASLGNNQFNSWTIGLRLDMPIGFRDANAQVRQQQMTLTRTYLQLKDSELRVAEYVVDQLRRVVETHSLIAPARARREALQNYVARVRIRIEIGSFRSEEYFNFLQVQRDLADSIAAEFQAVAQYNSALASFEFAKGTIQRYNSITMSEGPLPAFVRERAADHERERVNAAIKLRERPGSDPSPQSPPHNLGPAGPGADGLPRLMNMPAPPPDVNPDAMPGARPGVVPQPLPQPMNVPMQPGVLAPRGVPMAPVGNPAGTPEPGAFFTPSGTVTVPRFQPITPPAPLPGPMGNAVPTSERPTVPPLDVGGIPASLPPMGVPPVNVTQ